MIKIYQQLLLENSKYANPKTKIARMTANREIFPIVKGLYETDEHVNPFYLSEAIYSPSYISFQSALAEYGLIPERVFAVTCATFGKRRSKKYVTPFGTYFYRDIPESAYPYAVTRIEVGNYAYDIAKPEKALCDMIYSMGKIGSQKEIKEILTENLRIEIDDLMKMDISMIAELAELYRSRGVRFLAKYLQNESRRRMRKL